MTTTSPDPPEDTLANITNIDDLARILSVNPRSLESVLRNLLDDRLVLDVPDVQRILGLKSRRSVEELIRTGQLKSYKVLSLRKIDRAAVHAYLESCAAS